MDKEVLENYQKSVERKSLYESFGYDVEGERNFIIGKAQPISGNILEAGTGKGHFTLALANAGYTFTTFDISETEQTFAKLILKYFDLDKQADFRIENGEHLNFKENNFDVIFSINTIHHFINPYQVIEELLRVLSLKGKLVLSDFTKEGFELMDKIHASEGNKHEVNKATLLDIKSYLINKSFKIEEHKTKFQEVIIAYR